MGIVPRSALAWEGFPIDGFQLFAGTGDVVHYHLDFSLTCPVPANFAARVHLPDGWLYKPGTTRWKYGTGTPVTGANPTTTSRSGARWSDLPGTPCVAGAGSRPVELTFDALSGLTLGVEEATASVTMGATTNTTDPQAPVLVTQNWENNDTVAAAPTIQQNRLVVGHIAKSGDVEVFRMPVPTVRGTRTTVYLSHMGEGADFDLVVGKPDAPSLQSNPVGSIPVGSIPVEDGGSFDRQPQRSASARDAAGHPGRLDPGREHLGEPRLRGRGCAGRRRRRGGLLHDHGERLQRLSQRRAVRPARRADAFLPIFLRARLAGSRSVPLGRLRRPPQARRRSSSSTASG